MATEVLGGLIMNICELYLDDVIVYAESAQELESRLRRCFERFQDKGITLNPAKCKLFVPSVEYCGHLIDKEGLHFTRSKLDAVTDFAIPETQQGLRSFLGLANWFRDHVNDHSRLVRPLHTMLNGYSKNKKLIWTEELLHSFERVKKAIHECPKLFFLDDTSPIYVHTDASQYGMGAYLFQVRDGIHYPIRFISKAFDERMSRWSTIQQEGYAIYYAITQWDFLLRDRRFTLRTDHDNLTMLKEESNAKVVRWMLALQAYDFEVEHIKGTLNIVADGLSRLCPDERLQTLGKSTAYPNSSTGTGSALQNNDNNFSEEREETRVDVLELESFDSVDQLSIPRLLIAQRIENHRHYAIQIECWALSVSKNQTLSDTELTERINEVHNDTIGHHGINRTITLVKESPRIRAAI